MKTRITELLGIEHPIIQGGMHYVGFADYVLEKGRMVWAGSSAELAADAKAQREFLSI